MEWLWLLVFVLGLGAMWLIIWGLEKLVAQMKIRDDERQVATDKLAKRIAAEEENFERKQAAKDYLSQPHPAKADGRAPQEFVDAIKALSTEELLDTMVQQVFGEPQDTANITASQSAFSQQPAKTVVASGNGVLPVKTKRADDKAGLSKAEQKMLKKIKQGS